jgi:hypothetical protein
MPGRLGEDQAGMPNRLGEGLECRTGWVKDQACRTGWVKDQACRAGWVKGLACRACRLGWKINEGLSLQGGIMRD